MQKFQTDWVEYSNKYSIVIYNSCSTDYPASYQVQSVSPGEDSECQAKIITPTWAMNKKSNVTFCAQINGCGYEKVDGIHYGGS